MQHHTVDSRKLEFMKEMYRKIEMYEQYTSICHNSKCSSYCCTSCQEDEKKSAAFTATSMLLFFAA